MCGILENYGTPIPLDTHPPELPSPWNTHPPWNSHPPGTPIPPWNTHPPSYYLIIYTH